MIYANDFTGKSDNEIIENAILKKDADGVVVIMPKKDGKAWLLDRAILLPSDTTVVLKNCKLKLSDKCRDNFFRSANCGIGKGDPEKLTNIHIIGEGFSVLEGADHPRATGDSSKTLHNPCPHDEKDLLLYDSTL